MSSKEDFISLESKIFLQKNGVVYIGGEAVDDKMRSLLRDQAKNFQSSNLFEIIDATNRNEASNLALKDSGKSGSVDDDVRFAKALYHWNHVMVNIVNALAK